MIDDIILDHVAVAYERRRDAWARFGGDLPGAYLAGGTGNGFANYQLDYANGMRLEVLEPAQVDQNDFLRRFLDRNGTGPHHLTYKVADIEAAIAVIGEAGFHPVGVNIGFPFWKELFLHPKEVPGVVIQIAQSEGGGWDSTTPPGFPSPRTSEHASLDRVAHAVADRDEGLRVFRDLLGGAVDDEGPDWIELGWRRGGRVRLLTGPAVAAWLDGRAGRVHHLAFTTRDPSGIADAVRVGESEVFEVAPEHNHGTRLRLHPV